MEGMKARLGTSQVKLLRVLGSFGGSQRPVQNLS